jgi:hypothetical protein
MTEQVFVSYSRHDASLVTPVVRLLRSTNDFVFLDADSIKPGEKWRAALAEAIRGANLVVVFWCRHSSESSEVESEYRSAIEARKDVIPVLLDSTPVPPALGEFQWIDFRELGREKHARLDAPAPIPSPAARPLGVWRGAVAAAAAVLVGVAAFSLLMLRSAAPTLPGPQPQPEPFPPSTSTGGWLVAIVVMVLASILLIALRRRRTSAQAAPTASRATASGQDKAMAETLENELRRRLTR